MPEVSEQLLAQYKAADETCYALAVAIHLGGLNEVELGWRSYIGKGGLLQWTELALPREPLPRRPQWSSSRPRR